MGPIAFLTDRPPAEALPAISWLGLDVKAEPLATDSLGHLLALSPSATLVDAEADPEAGYDLLVALSEARAPFPVVALLGPDDLERFPWHEVADDVVFAAASEQELRLRLALASRRGGEADEPGLRLGPLTINTETYRVAVAGRVLDLTFKEFELLRFLIQRPGRVSTRAELLQEVWGYNFYGGTRTVDVHIRRLRAKLGAEHEALIETVRGVGYRAARPGLTSN